MLEQLSLRNFVFSKRLELKFSDGFCVLTGDSGAGKSLLVNVLSTLLGAKLSANLLLEGESAEVEAVFTVVEGAKASAWLADNELLNEDDADCLIVRRIIGGVGKRSTSFINGRQVALSQLTEVVGRVMEICGQQSHYSLRSASAQREIVDRGANADIKQIAVLYRDYQAVKKQWEQALLQQQSAKEQQLLLKQSLAELQALDFSDEKWLEMNTALSQMTHASDLMEGCQRALAQLDGDNAYSVQSFLAAIKNEIEIMRRVDERLADVGGVLDDMMVLANDANQAISRYAESIQFDFQSRTEIEAFIAQCHHLARKYGVSSPAKLGDYQDEVESILATLPTPEECERLEKRVEANKSHLLDACQILSNKRQVSAQALSESVNALLKKLAMVNAQFMVEMEMLAEPTITGHEQVAFNIRTGATSAIGSIAEVASGGELSRLGLAIALSSGKGDEKSVAIFDEVDSGVSGAIAGEIGELLQTLGQTRQVICVTHLPQVASYADCHWLVQGGGGNTLTVSELATDKRIEEIARLYSGSKITDAARRHAQEMLNDAQI